jgi:heat shock protein HtpX
MPFTFVEIEEHKTRRLLQLFAALIVLHAVSIVILLWGFHLFVGLPGRLSAGEMVVAIGLALIAALIHWTVSTRHLVDRVLRAVIARPLEPGDTYHDRLRNVVEEVSVATGGRLIEPYVVPTTAMNACAIADFSGRAAIAVTEGLLARLSRPRLESVIGHEAAHLASGDSLVKSVICGLFGLHEEGLKHLSGIMRRRWRLRGRAVVLILFVAAVLWVTNKVKRICELVISRTLEYRADAVAVRLTRNPLALAEALHVISKRWHGVGMQGESLALIFIADPVAQYLREEGPWASWLSTHPPMERRINFLLGMSHVQPEQFEQEVVARLRQGRVRQPVEPRRVTEAASGPWFVWLDGQWDGPFGLEALGDLSALSPETWVRREGDETAVPAMKDPEIFGLLKRRYDRGTSAQELSRSECPNCRLPLTRLLYEGVPLDECPSCRGCYVTQNQMTRIFAREDYEFPEGIKRLASTLPSVRGAERTHPPGMPPYHQPLPDRKCPACGSAVVRKFFTEAYRVEVEQCWACGLTWLDHEELELLQYLHEDRRPERE